MSGIFEQHRAVLAGPKHCGKSTLGRLLAAAWSVDFIDTDELLAAGRPVRELYRELGEEAFRRREAGIVRSLGGGGPRVIALGGGVVGNRFVSRDDLRALGPLVFLDLDDEICISRVLAGGIPAFLGSAADPAAELRRINAERRCRCREYADAVFAIRGAERPPEVVAAELAAFLEER